MNRLQRIVGQLPPSFPPSQGMETKGELQIQDCSAQKHYSCIRVSREDRVGIIHLHRPEALNALNDTLISELAAAIQDLDRDPSIGCVILTGSGDRAFAAGADIKEMKDLDFHRVTQLDKFSPLESALGNSGVPVIAAVNGYALGGGCEIAMMCDIILASERAVFGQPEIKIGTIPGAGGTQRLLHALGKSKTMELVLSGRNLRAREALQFGLVAGVYPPEELFPEAMKLAREISQLSRPVVRLGKEAVNAAFNTTLQQGIALEKRLFQSTFAIQDRKEGMTAFAEKRRPNWEHR